MFLRIAKVFAVFCLAAAAWIAFTYFAAYQGIYLPPLYMAPYI